MTRGRYAGFFWVGRRRSSSSQCFAPLDRASSRSPLALVGLLAYEHAYVQAGQSVPLA